jgi:hypothetical protein
MNVMPLPPLTNRKHADDANTLIPAAARKALEKSIIGVQTVRGNKASGATLADVPAVNMVARARPQLNLPWAGLLLSNGHPHRDSIGHSNIPRRGSKAMPTVQLPMVRACLWASRG